jgi:hypothetical protein
MELQTIGGARRARLRVQHPLNAVVQILLACLFFHKRNSCGGHRLFDAKVSQFVVRGTLARRPRSAAFRGVTPVSLLASPTQGK